MLSLYYPSLRHLMLIYGPTKTTFLTQDIKGICIESTYTNLCPPQTQDPFLKFLGYSDPEATRLVTVDQCFHRCLHHEFPPPVALYAHILLAEGGQHIVTSSPPTEYRLPLIVSYQLLYPLPTYCTCVYDEGQGGITFCYLRHFSVV